MAPGFNALEESSKQLSFLLQVLKHHLGGGLLQ